MITCDAGCNRAGIDIMRLGELPLAWCGDEECLTKIFVKAKAKILPYRNSVRIQLSQPEHVQVTDK